MKITIRGEEWSLMFVPVEELRDCLGDCDLTHRTIRVLKTLRGRELLRVVAHELLHASGWHLTEAFVDLTSTDMAAALTAVGFRRQGRQATSRRRPAPSSKPYRASARQRRARG